MNDKHQSISERDAKLNFRRAREERNAELNLWYARKVRRDALVAIAEMTAICIPILALFGGVCLFLSLLVGNWLSGYPTWSEPYRSVGMVYSEAAAWLVLKCLHFPLLSMWRWNATPYYGVNCIISVVCCSFWLASIGAMLLASMALCVWAIDPDEKLSRSPVGKCGRACGRLLLAILAAPILFVVAYGVVSWIVWLVVVVVSYVFIELSRWLFRPT